MKALVSRSCFDQEETEKQGAEKVSEVLTGRDVSIQNTLTAGLLVYNQMGVHAQSCQILCNPMDCSPPGPVHVIFPARILEQVAISYSRGSFQPRDGTHDSSGRTRVNWQVDSLSLSHLGSPIERVCIQPQLVPTLEPS